MNYISQKDMKQLCFNEKPTVFFVFSGFCSLQTLNKKSLNLDYINKVSNNDDLKIYNAQLSK